jgi:hypothetical protein
LKHGALSWHTLCVEIELKMEIEYVDGSGDYDDSEDGGRDIDGNGDYDENWRRDKDEDRNRHREEDGDGD